MDKSPYTNAPYDYGPADFAVSAARQAVFAALNDLRQTTSDGSTASYYELPVGATELQDLISHRDLNAQMGEIFRAVYRYGQCPHSPKLRDAKKIKFYIDAEIARLEKLDK